MIDGMKKVNATIDKEECYELADKLFFEMSGINKEGEKYDRMRKDAVIMRELIEDRIGINMKCNYYDDIEIEGRTAEIGGEVFNCSAFEQIDPDTVKGVYVYALTSGEYDIKDESIINRVYTDIWGTAFTEAARIMLNRELSKKDRLSDLFGPGFYGMNTGEMGKIDILLGFKNIGVEYRNNRIMVPVKSCTGLVFSVTDGYKKIDSACRDCMGTHNSCKLCRATKQKKE